MKAMRMKILMRQMLQSKSQMLEVKVLSHNVATSTSAPATATTARTVMTEAVATTAMVATTATVARVIVESVESVRSAKFNSAKMMFLFQSGVYSTSWIHMHLFALRVISLDQTMFMFHYNRSVATDCVKVM